MMQHITNWAKGIWSRLTLSRQANVQFPESQPDQTRRMILAGGAALALTGLLVPGLMTTEAEAHSWRRSRRRRRRRHYWRRSRRRRHHWRRSRRRRHYWRRSRRRGWY
jgi:hypothetical protein